MPTQSPPRCLLDPRSTQSRRGSVPPRRFTPRSPSMFASTTAGGNLPLSLTITTSQAHFCLTVAVCTVCACLPKIWSWPIVMATLHVVQRIDAMIPPHLTSAAALVSAVTTGRRVKLWAVPHRRVKNNPHVTIVVCGLASGAWTRDPRHRTTGRTFLRLGHLAPRQ